MTKKELEIKLIRLTKEIEQNKELTIESLAKQLALANSEIKRLKQQNSLLEEKLKKKKRKPEGIRHSKEYKLFREKILKRDSYKCTKCGSNEKLHVHHIKSVGERPELALEESNVVTLCAKCHIDTENYLNNYRR